MRRAFLTAAIIWQISTAVPAATVAGIPIEDTAMVGGQTLVLNGAGVRKRGYLTGDVQAVYLTERRTSLSAINELLGPKRIYIQALREAQGATLGRYFVGDFGQAATPEEFKKLITEVGQIGGVYGGVHKINKGDVVTIDWIPGKGVTTAINGKVLQLTNDGGTFLNNPLLFEIFLRMYSGGKLPEELRLNMLGISHTMMGKQADADR